VERASKTVPAGINRMNRLDDPDRFPLFFERNDGPFTWDVDGNRYFDLIAGKGAVLLGHCDPRIDDAVRAELDRGVMRPLMPARYVDAAEALTRLMPALEQVKFFRTGSCAVTAAVRLCRVATGKRRILSAGYHGWHDWFTEARRSYPADDVEVIDFHYDLGSLESLFARRDEVAAVVFTPEPALFGPELVAAAAELAHDAGCLFVLDEMRTCIRFGASGGYGALAGVRADLTTVGKAIANGFALSAVGGRREVMAAEMQTHLNGTYETEAVGLAAGTAMLQLAPELDYTRLAQLYDRFEEAFNRTAASHGVAALMVAAAGNAQLIFEDERAGTEFYRQAAARGVLFYCFDDLNLMFAHEPVLDELIERTCEALATIGGARRAAPLSREAVHRYLVRHRIVSKRATVDAPVVAGVYRRIVEARR
jgi:glutamate-1-semialdehyde 2,1-aminomutase/neamine transaminase/2'-deamino-2'-hydroxyneamine transaminase/neomycin C transaminase